MTGKLSVDSSGRVTGPANITHNDPFPCVNGDPGGMSVPHGIQGLVMHTMVGNLPGTIEVFNRPSFQASAHFGVDQSGAIHQFGSVRGWKAWAQEAGNPNWYSCEFADDGNPDNPLTQAQITAAAQLLECLSAPGVGNFPLQIANSTSGEGLGVHFMGSLAWGGHTCPDIPPAHVRSGQRPQIVALAMAIRSGSGGLKTWTAAGQLSLHDLAAADLHQDAASVLALTARHSPGGVLSAGLAQYVDTVFAGDASRCPAGVTWHYPGKGGMAASWKSEGRLSLSALASQLGTRPSVVLQVTADVAGGFGPAAAGYVNAVFAGSALHLPEGAVLYYGTAS